MQSWIRKRLKPPVQDHVTLLAILDQSISALAHLTYLTDQIEPVAFLRLAAVSVEHRGQGGHVADATMERVLRRTATDLNMLGHRSATVMARINRNNSPSQALALRHNFEADGPSSPAVQTWTLGIDW